MARGTDPTPLDGVDLLLTDLDGVIYQGPDAIPYAIEAINAAAETRHVGYITNNASRSAASVAEHLASLGLTLVPDDVVTSPQAAIRLLEALVPAGSAILVVGGDGLTSVVSAAGFTVTDSALDMPAAVIQGFSPDLGWKQLAEASFALNDDPNRPWVATNTDWTIPVARGIAPGNGTLVAAVHNAVDRLPVVAGKPEKAIFEEAIRRFGGKHPLMLGDRLDTDILGANRSGIPSLLVLTGIDRAKQVLAAVKNERPTFILSDLRQLTEPYLKTTEKTRGSTRTITVGDAVVTQRDGEVRVVEAGRAIDRLRAGTTAVWGADRGIHSLDVDPALYEAE